MLHHIARQRLGEWLAGGLAPRCRCVDRRRGFILRRRRCFSDLLLKVAEHQFELLDRAAQLLR
jgi:hypothetical protein